MIDIELEIYNEIYEYVTEEYDIVVYDEIILAPEVFPCVCVEEINNTIKRSTIDSGSNENYVDVDYEVRVYSNKASGKKDEARRIFSKVDEWFINHGFVRIMQNPVTFDDTKYRIIGRYTATVDKNQTIYRR